MGYIIILLFILIFIFRQPIKQWLARQAANRAEDYIRQATGLPPRPGSRRARKQAAASAGTSTSYAHTAGSGTRRRRPQQDDGKRHIIPPEYAEDVDFVETIDYSETTIRVETSEEKNSFRVESQVTDVEWVEIKNTKR